MNISQRLRTCAKHTGLDAVIELLNEAADEIDALQARAQVQGEPSWWMRETAEGVEWTDTAPLVLSGWTPLYTTPQPAQAAQAEVTDAQINAAYRDWCKTNGTPESFARAILALRPVQVPMTDDEATAMIRETVRGNTIRRDGSTSLQIVRAAEAHHGITAQAKKESA